MCDKDQVYGWIRSGYILKDKRYEMLERLVIKFTKDIEENFPDLDPEDYVIYWTLKRNEEVGVEPRPKPEE